MESSVVNLVGAFLPSLKKLILLWTQGKSEKIVGLEAKLLELSQQLAVYADKKKSGSAEATEIYGLIESTIDLIETQLKINNAIDQNAKIGPTIITVVELIGNLAVLLK